MLNIQGKRNSRKTARLS